MCNSTVCNYSAVCTILKILLVLELFCCVVEICLDILGFVQISRLADFSVDLVEQILVGALF